ncbi:chloride transporter [Helicobacter sp. 16-1353]|uniref:chorismate-binding protein n=1 Tax=Helicobacter sp. 16-1353 TaxID=2004996 RepID=UPI000DCE8B3C|nr:bifunctional anthranilate synthase component I family protein/class IV aminotransferase [Helicobacter sp. 16-1353]RAX54410.1 chloride transporter [Helicobacter sp. 16-1353]
MAIYSNKVFENPIEIIDIKGKQNISSALNKLERLSRKFYALGYINYDYTHLYFEIFDSYKKYIPSKIPTKLGIIKNPLITKNEYLKNVEIIKENIANGITYEVNYTYPFHIKTNLDGLELYESLLAKQKTPYTMFMQNKYISLLSYSPELFFRIKNNKIYTKPMKGTAPRGKGIDDNEMYNFLYNDIKNRAENIMIVDLIRNDLSIIAKCGSVRVDKLFDIEKHLTLFQMTSKISAELKDDVRLSDVFRAIFPCGSITGAPKISTMRIIKEIESFNRNIYCGAIGFLSPKEIIFSIPIRILYGQNHNYTYHTGSAIIWDSVAEDEFEETIIKTKFLDTDFQLIETAIDDWDRHLQRLKKSAKELGFIWNKELENITLQKNKITRVILNKDGFFKLEIKDLNHIKTKKICLKGQVNSKNPFLYHKTNIRIEKSGDYFDEIRINEKGEITEGTFTNIAIKTKDGIFTPPIACGLLAGIYRAKLLDENFMSEKVLYPKDLKTAEKIYCFNSVRKLVEVELC